MQKNLSKNIFCTPFVQISSESKKVKESRIYHAKMSEPSTIFITRSGQTRCINIVLYFSYFLSQRNLLDILIAVTDVKTCLITFKKKLERNISKFCLVIGNCKPGVLINLGYIQQKIPISL